MKSIMSEMKKIERMSEEDRNKHFDKIEQEIGKYDLSTEEESMDAMMLRVAILQEEKGSFEGLEGETSFMLFANILHLATKYFALFGVARANKEEI